ncbi:MAG: copper oxidase [Methylococcaceae bacterium]|nr:MAG: copper oxidase [Methylococcaceae bacterium]
MKRQLIVGLTFALAAMTAQAQPREPKQEVNPVVHDALMDHGDGHLMDMQGGMIMGQNKDTLPGGCDEIAENKEITVKAGRKYAKPGFIFGFDQNQWKVKPCTRLTVNFINEDNVRHQWMMHGLPKYIYQKGMFHLEITGPAKITGTLILPPNDKTFLVHCDIAQHMEKGMKAELVSGKGTGDLPSIPGLTPHALPDSYNVNAPEPVPSTVLAEQVDVAAAALKAKGGDSESAPGAAAKGAKATADKAPSSGGSWLSGMTILGIAIGVFGAPHLWQRIRARSKGDDLASLVDATVDLLKEWLGMALDLAMQLYHRYKK